MAYLDLGLGRVKSHDINVPIYAKAPLTSPQVSNVPSYLAG